MRRHGFTMIELIFVIVIIGILAAVAIPRLAGVQDDALIASEKSGIGAARSSVIAIRGKALARGTDFNMTVLDKNKQEHTVTAAVDQNSSGNLHLSKYYYPIQLSIDDSGTPTQAQGLGGNAMAIVLEPDGREKYKTEKDSNDSNNSKVYGPATISVSDPNAELHNGMYWEYNSTNGIFTKSGS